ncbi:site-specific DNA-methyltransferase [Brachybacterium squillarum]|uniref:site-specific DNA-methyltransferase n=1 Tax=Brachybacterium squillarum TaxID=661979 RepID=UPI000262941F|nr:site-specific DNA-methyltransferase [Brachybacterium squillarum]
MDHLRMHSADLTARNIDQLAELFPAVVTETRDELGEVKRAIDFDLLRQELSDHVVEGPQERYQLDWPGKREALFAANAPIAKTLRPQREESVDFDSTKNLFIEGDNLEALKLLQESYLGKVKLIYIDPPYNTGHDFVYNDSFAQSSSEYLERSGQKDESGAGLKSNPESNGRFHSDWLSMMYPRLKLARNLLRDDGVLVVSIDENEHAHLVELGQQIFGLDSYVGEIVLKNSSKNDQRFISIQHEYIVFFVKSRSVNGGQWTERKGGLEDIYRAFANLRARHGDDWDAIHKGAQAWYKQFSPSDPIYGSKHYSWMDERGVYFPADISGPNDGQYVYPVIHPVTGVPVKEPSRGWAFPESTMDRMIAEGRVHFGPDHHGVPKLKTYLSGTEDQSLTSVRFVDGRAASKRLRQLFGNKVFTNPKDEILLSDIYAALGVGDSDIILDMFSGSGSALHAAWEFGKKNGRHPRFIGIQIAEHLHDSLKTAQGAARQITANAINMLEELEKPAVVSEIAKQRLRVAGRQIGIDSQVDTGFRSMKIDTTNMADTLRVPDSLAQGELTGLVDNVKPGRSGEDLLFQVMLDWGLELSLPIAREEIDGREVLSVDDDALLACFAQDVIPTLITSLAARKPLRVVFRDSAFVTDSARINAEQVFAEVSPSTDVKVI